MRPLLVADAHVFAGAAICRLEIRRDDETFGQSGRIARQQALAGAPAQYASGQQRPGQPYPAHIDSCSK